MQRATDARIPRHVTAFERGAGGGALYVQSWLPAADARAALVLLHGLAEHSGRYAELTGRLVDRGLAVYALDHRGHGRSAGPRANVGRFDWLVADAVARIERARAEQPGRPLVLLGHSMGGAVALATALARPDLVGALALSAPAVGADPAVPRLRLALAQLLSAVAPSVGVLRLPSDALSRDPRVGADYDRDPLVFRGAVPARSLVELLAAMRRLHAEAPALRTPVLVQHGTDDRLVPLRFTEPVYARLGSADCTIRRYAGLYHEIYNEPERGAVFADLEAWLERRL
jgi:alpha-beta hydrolase superfamily lysophospholipase